MAYRTEKDSLGNVKVPADAYYGAQTQRAINNYQISGIKFPFSFIKAQAIIKRSAALANMKDKRLDRKKGGAVIKAADEVMKGKLIDQFILDVYQSGAGVSQNMNINEVLANRATQILGGRKGDYIVNPNDHVNMSQSTNDTIHTAIHITSTEGLDGLIDELDNLKKTLDKKSKQFNKIVKSGRTHLQDAVH